MSVPGARLGFLAAVGLVAVGVAYAIVLAVGMAQAGLSAPIVDPVLALMEALTLISAPLLVGLTAAIHGVARPERRAQASVAFAFGVLAAGLTSGVHFVSLTVGRQTGAAVLAWPSTAYALELLAWDVFLGLALVFAAPVFAGPGIQAVARRALAVSGWLCLLGTIGPLAGDLRLQRVGILGYAVGLPVACGALAIAFAGMDAPRPSTNRGPPPVH